MHPDEGVINHFSQDNWVATIFSKILAITETTTIGLEFVGSSFGPPLCIGIM